MRHELLYTIVRMYGTSVYIYDKRTISHVLYGFFLTGSTCEDVLLNQVYEGGNYE